MSPFNRDNFIALLVSITNWYYEHENWNSTETKCNVPSKFICVL